MSKIGYHRSGYLEDAANGHPEQVKSRQCLKCRLPFVSTWSGERVCPKCKGRRAWRDGVASNMGSWSQW